MADHSHLDDATYWSTRAKEMRALPQQADASHKDFLLGMAKEYERLVPGAFFILCQSAGTEPAVGPGVSKLVICARCRTGQMISPGPPCASQPGGSGRLSRSAPCLICECPHGGPRASFGRAKGLPARLEPVIRTP